MALRHGVDFDKAQALHRQELAMFSERRPRSRQLSAVGGEHLLFGAPLHWMADWSTPFNLYVEEARGARLRDVDGHEYLDFCLGDTGAMFGHSPEPVVRAIADQAARGLTAMLPSPDAVWVAEELARRFGLSHWQFALSASDANRFALRWLRAASGRDRIIVFNGCYHGTVDDAFVDLIDGRPRRRASLLGQTHDPAAYTRVVEFNDLEALDRALSDERVACVLSEPVMTNIGMVLPEPGFWSAAQDLIRRYGSYLLLDETHTISSGPGGYGAAYGLKPDALVLGKPLGGGLPCAVYGFSEELAERAQRAKRSAAPGHSGIGTTLSGNMLAAAAMRANLAEVMSDAAYQRMFALAQHLADGLQDWIERWRLPWCVSRVGARCEFQFSPRPPRNGGEAGAMQDEALERVIHLYLLNRGFLITPFHNMLLLCPDTEFADVDRLLEALDGFAGEVV